MNAEKARELRAEIRKIKSEMRACGIKRTSCFNRVDRETYRYNAALFALETELKTLERSTPTTETEP